MILFPDDIPEDEIPKVTIIIANYNYEQYVTYAILSAIKQNYQKVHIPTILLPRMGSIL